MSTSSAGEGSPGPELISVDDAFARIKVELGITKWTSFKQWRYEQKIPTIHALDRAAFEEALARSETRGAWRRPKSSKENEQ